MLRFFQILSIFIFCSLTGMGQGSQDQLEAKRKKLDGEIAYTNKLLDETRSSKKNTLNELKLLNVKISKRSDLVATLKTEIYNLENQIEETEIAIVVLNENLNDLKVKYAKVAWHAYKYSSSYNKLIFLFSADGINQAYQRMRYLDQIADFIRKEAIRISKAEEEQEDLLNKLTTEKNQKKILLDIEQDEIIKIEDEKIQKSKLKTELQSQENDLRKTLRKKEKEVARLDKQIQDIIAAETAAKKDASTGKTYELTPAEKTLSASFEDNRGHLPWPVERGVISETYGVHNHPVLKKVKTKNNGINIATTAHSEARAVYKGKVVSITKISNSNTAVIIKHGEYFTVYSNLDKVYIKKGDMVGTKEAIGQIHTNLKGETELHFEVWKSRTKQNPAYWISKK